MNNTEQNVDITVTAYYFAGGNIERSFPKRIELGDSGRQLNFIESGLRCVIKKGQQITEIFNMSDGQNNYRLKFEPSLKSWQLVGFANPNGAN